MTDLAIWTERGMTIRFDETEARATGRRTQGVNGVKLREGDAVAAVSVIPAGIVSEAVEEAFDGDADDDS